MTTSKQSNELAAGFAGATFAALIMLLLGIGWNIGFTRAQLNKWQNGIIYSAPVSAA